MKFSTCIFCALLFILSISSCSKENQNSKAIENTDNEIKILNWFYQMQLDNGLIPSSLNSNVSLYDNALAAMVFMLYDDIISAEKIFDFFNSRLVSEFLTDSGGFSQFRYPNGLPTHKHQWMGDNAWLLIALNNYKHKTGLNNYNRLSTEIEKWLIGLQNESGALYAGFDGNTRIELQVTEGIIDAFNAVPGYTYFHENILRFLKQERWNSDINSLTTGWDAFNYALDLHPWSYCIFNDFPKETLIAADMYKVSYLVEANDTIVEGFCFDLDKDNIWFEGVGEMVVAFKQAGMENMASHYLGEMKKAIISSSFKNAWGIPYASNGNSTRFGPDSLYLTEYTEPFVSSAAWYLFGVKNFNPFGVGRAKEIPEADIFWK